MNILHALKIVLLATCIAVSSTVFADELQLADEHPVSYTVVKGDTLWDIAGKFLKDPWRWPDIWRENPYIENPDLIYPGDKLVLRYDANGQPYLEHLSGRERAARKVVKMTPAVYIEKLDDAIPVIPPKYILSFLQDRRLVETANLDALPYVTEGMQGEILLGALSQFYARGVEGEPGSRFRIVRMRGPLVDPDSKKVIAYETETLGEAEMLRPGDPAKLRVTKARLEINQGNRLVPVVEKVSLPYFHPQPYRDPINFSILGAVSDVGEFGPGDVVTLSKGSADGLRAGHVLQVMRNPGETKDPVSGHKYRLPIERSGIVMVFQTYDRISYGLIMRATHPVHVYDRVINFD